MADKWHNRLILIEGAAILSSELWVVQVAPTFRPEIPARGGVSDDVECHKLRKTDFRGIMERSIRTVTKAGARLIFSTGVLCPRPARSSLQHVILK